MVAFKSSPGRTSAPELPLEIYSSLVDALYDDRRSLFIGSAAASLAVLVTAWESGHWLLIAFSVAIGLIALARARDMRAYAAIRHQTLTRVEVRRWEHRYVIGSAAYVALLGAWTLAAFVTTSDPFVQIFSFAVIFGYLIGTPGRNFASNLLVTTQIICAGIPLSAAFLYMGGYYYFFFLLVLAPFFSALKFISDRLRRTLFDAVIATRNVTQLAERFDTALNNMPHGLCMFDADKRLVVSNAQVASLLEVEADSLVAGVNASEMLRNSRALAGADHRDARDFIATFEASLSGRTGSRFAEIREGKTLSFTTQPMENGGSVMVIEDVSERRKAEERIRYLARYDSLTGLPNRGHFHDELARILAASAGAGSLAILFIDLDEFKQVNDTLGHPSGDALLTQVAHRLRQIIRSSDMVGRFGGDEFVVLQAPFHEPAESSELAHRVLTEIARPYDVDGHNVVIGASVGIAIAPRDGIDADQLLMNADMALYYAKASGRGAWRFFEPEMDVKARARRELELDLREALTNDDFELNFQPLFNMRTMKVSTCEALLRWPHPTRGMVPPSEFIPVAEEMGIIVEIGEWVIRRACKECLKWPEPVRVAVNLSPIQFRRSDVVAAVAGALAESGLPASRLEVEITESVLLQNVEAARDVLDRLHDLGVCISLDDFGTGYSGLSYLQSFPLDKVKIDRSFVPDFASKGRTLTLLSGMARLSKALGMTVVVEGVETSEQLDIIAAEEAIDEVQGYFLSVPIGPRQIYELLTTMQSPRQGRETTASQRGPRKVGALN